MSARTPGPLCQISNPQIVDKGTNCLSQSPSPALIGRQTQDLRGLDEALDALQATAQNFAWRYIQDAKARATYVQRIAEAARTIRADVLAGKMSAAEGAAFAAQSRNMIMEEIRAITSAIGKAGAEAMKGQGLTLEMALDKAVKKLFPGQTFAQLSAAQKRLVFLEIVDASGRSSPKVTGQIPRWRMLGRGLAVVTVAISIYNIWEAKNKLRQSVKEGATLAGGVLGGAAATASAGFVCGPGAPVCVTALFIVGGIFGAMAASAAADQVLDQRDVVNWLGE
ncbi:hypothetical protein [Roseateles sp. L2-2]|uniref:hypothetical protein n=1 Tax=Roseateles sp. L2-2 TaxID=3422597 RepID=UPI003D35EDEA